MIGKCDGEFTIVLGQPVEEFLLVNLSVVHIGSNGRGKLFG